MNAQWLELKSLLLDAYQRFSQDEAPRFGASLAYYAVFSLVPLLVIAITVAGFFFGSATAQQEILFEARAYLGEEGAGFIEESLRAANDRETGAGITALSTLLILLGATAVFKELKEALNRVFDAPKSRGGIGAFFRKNILLFGLVLALGFLLLVSLVISAMLSFLSGSFNEILELSPFFWQGLNFLVSFAVTGALFGLLYRFLPDTRLPWRPIVFGAVVTAFFFTVGKSLIGFYLGHSSAASAYGAAGTVILILLWTYYSSQIILFGAELTAVHATRQGYLAHRAETQSSSAKDTNKKDFLARVISLVIFFFLRRFLRRFSRRFRG